MKLCLELLLAFATSLAIDWSYACWMLSVSDKRKVRACVYSSVCSLLGSVAVWLFVDNWISVFPAALGHALGTWLAIESHANFRAHEQKMADLDALPRYEDDDGYRSGGLED